MEMNKITLVRYFILLLLKIDKEKEFYFLLNFKSKKGYKIFFYHLSILLIICLQLDITLLGSIFSG